jgi:glycosyltransferase involved in cell wall biosynthesis
MNPLLESLRSLIGNPAAVDADAHRRYARHRTRLLLLTDTPILGPGGSERFLRNLLFGLDTERYCADLVQLCEPPDSVDPDCALPPLDCVRFEYRPVDTVYGRRGRAVYRELRARMLAGRYDIVQSQHEKSDLLNALLPRGPANAVRISNRRDTGFQKSPRLRRAFRLLNPRFDWLIGPSQAVLDQVRDHEGTGEARIRCLPNGVDTARFAPLRVTDRGLHRLHAGLPPEGFLIGCAARLVPVKRHADLIEAFALIAESQPQAQLVLIGDGPLRAELGAQVSLAGLDGRVHFLGERKDIEILLPLLDAFALASRTEGMSNALLEAMACGLPTVATAVGGNPEVVEPEVTGLLVPPCTPDALAYALHTLAVDPPRARLMGGLGRARVERRFSLRALIDGFDALYRECKPELAGR